MNSIDNDDIRRISSQLDNFYTAYRSYIYYSLITSKANLEVSADSFWKFQKYLLLFSLVVNWCEVFGALAKNNHWKEITVENSEFTKLLYEQSNYDYSSWSSYRKYIEDTKKSYLINPDIYHHKDPKVDLTGIDVSLNVTHSWLNTLANNSASELASDVFEKWPICNLEFRAEIEEEFDTAFCQN